jgi:hypothetical protein
MSRSRRISQASGTGSDDGQVGVRARSKQLPWQTPGKKFWS